MPASEPTETKQVHPWSASERPMTERVGMYLVGVAIGCLLLGFFWSQKHKAQMAQDAERAAQQAPAAEQPPESAPPAEPETTP